MTTTFTTHQLSGAVIRRLREEKNLTMQDTAEAAGISRTYLWQIETSDHVPSFEIAKHLASILNVPLGELWTIYKDAIIQPPSFDYNNSSRNDSSQNDLTNITTFLKVNASVGQKGSRYAETTIPSVDYKIARDAVGEFAVILKREGDEIANFLLTASLCENHDNYLGAIEAYLSARNLLQDKNVKALIDWNLGIAYSEVCLYADAIRSYEQSLNWFTSNLLALDDMARIKTSLGWLYYRSGFYEKSIYYFHLAIADWNDLFSTISVIGDGLDSSAHINYENDVLAAYRGLGSVLERQGDFQHALENFDHVEKVAKDKEDFIQQAWVISRRGFLYIHSGDWKKAEEDMNKGKQLVIDLSKTAPNRRNLQVLREIILNNQGLLFIRKGEYDKALETSMQSLRLAESLKDKRGSAFCHMFISFAHVAKKEWDKGLEHVLLAEMQFKDMEILYYLPELYCAYAEIILNTVSAKGALLIAENALALSTGRNGISQYQEALTLRELGEIQALIGDIPSSRIHLEKSLQLLEIIQEPYDLALSHIVYSEILNNMGDLSETVKSHLDIARAIAEKLGAKGLIDRANKIDKK